MKKTLFFILLVFNFISCSQKEQTKGNFKLVLGSAALTVAMNGGSYVETENLNSFLKTIIKLDSENSAFIPQATYNMLFVTFAGPNERSGTMYCGSVKNASLLSATATITVTITQAECLQSKYAEIISKLTNNQISNWDTAKFDQGKWGL
jgi:hypothetical protein